MQLFLNPAFLFQLLDYSGRSKIIWSAHCHAELFLLLGTPTHHNLCLQRMWSLSLLTTLTYISHYHIMFGPTAAPSPLNGNTDRTSNISWTLALSIWRINWNIFKICYNINTLWGLFWKYVCLYFWETNFITDWIIHISHTRIW